MQNEQRKTLSYRDTVERVSSRKHLTAILGEKNEILAPGKPA